jgi:diguanylate cyclase (GGDEF)-like protein/PAS domain S-box-containing protein
MNTPEGSRPDSTGPAAPATPVTPAAAGAADAGLDAQQAALLEFSTEFVVFVDARGSVVTGVGAGLGVLGYDASDRRGHHIAEHLHPDDLPPVLEIIERARRQAGYRDVVQVRARRIDGQWLWFEATVIAVSKHPVLGDGAVLRVRHLDELERQVDPGEPDEERFLSLAEALPSGILSADARGWVVYCNGAAQQILDLPAERVGGRGWFDVVHAEDLADVMEATGLVISTGAAQQATFRIQTGLFVRWATARFVPLGERAGDRTRRTGWIATIDDITDRRRAESQLAHRATHDPLTDLPNRTLLEDRLEQACARLRRDQVPLSVLFVDLDGFKGINDTLGHHAGDEVLREVARRLRRVLRPADTVARLGGDEFVAVCEGLDAPDAEAVAGRIREAMSVPMLVGGTSLDVGASVGVATSSDEQQEAAELLARADQAMYRRKRGKGAQRVSRSG